MDANLPIVVAASLLVIIAKRGPIGGGVSTCLVHLRRMWPDCKILFVVDPEKPQRKGIPKVAHIDKGVLGEFVDSDMAIAIIKAHQGPKIMTCAFRPSQATYRILRETKIPVLVNGANEVTSDSVQCFAESNMVCYIRPPLRDLLYHFGLRKLQLLEYVYVPWFSPRVVKHPEGRSGAVAISRIAASKHTEMIVEANVKLDCDDQIYMYGYRDFFWAQRVLGNIDENWDRCYMGEFDKDEPARGVACLANYKYLVDMTVMKGDGGGAQFVTFEAFDAGAMPIMHRDWFTGNREWDLVLPSVLLADTSQTIADILKSDMTTQDTGQAVLDHHSPARISKQWSSVLT